MTSVIPNGRTALRTRPLEARQSAVGCAGCRTATSKARSAEAGLGQVSKSTVCEITQELRARFQAFRARSLDEVELVVLFCDAIYLPTRSSGTKEGC